MTWEKATAEPSQITDLIFLGSNKHATNLSSGNPLNIKAVLTVHDGKPPSVPIAHKVVPLADTEAVAVDDFKICLAFIRETVQRGERILIHCAAGRNRSAAILIGFLLVNRDYKTWHDALAFVKSKRFAIGCHSAIKTSVLSHVAEVVGVGETTQISNELDIMSSSQNEREERGKQLARLFIGELLPLLVQVRQDFLDKKPNETICGAKTWMEYCKGILRYSVRHIDRLIQDKNPASTKHNPRKREITDADVAAVVAENNGEPQPKIYETPTRDTAQRLQDACTEIGMNVEISPAREIGKFNIIYRNLSEAEIQQAIDDFKTAQREAVCS